MNEEKETNITKSRKTAFDKRIHEIDFLRGLLICLVLMDHIFNNLKNFGAGWCGGYNIFAGGFFDWYWTGLTPGYPVIFLRGFIQPICLALFCFVSGISCAFSRNNWKRAIETTILAVLIGLGSNAIQMLSDINNWGLSVRIDFNIIGVLGLSMLAYCCVQNRSWRILVAVIIATLLMYFFFIPNLKENFIRIFGSETHVLCLREYEVPAVYCPLFWSPTNALYDGAQQADYVALFPYIGFFFGGALFSYKFYRTNKKSLLPKHNFEKPICFIGRHTLIIYLGHMPIVYGIFSIIDVIVKSLR